MAVSGVIPVARPAAGFARLSATDKLFAGLRLFVLILGAAWLLLAPRLEYRRQFVGLYFLFLIYTLLAYGLVLWTRWPVDRIYLPALLLDLILLFRLVGQTGGVESVFVLGFYLLVGLHSFYFGLRIGMFLATAAALLLIGGSVKDFQAEPWLDSTVRLGFLYLIGWSIGLLADEEKKARRNAEQLLAQLQNTTRILEQAQKMALIGRLTAGIAHEINNPAAVILTKTERMLLEGEEKRDSSGLKRDLESLQRHAQRIAGTVQKLLTYSRPGCDEFEALSINQVIQQCIPLIEHRLEARRLTLNLNLLQRLPRIYGNANRLEEVFVNLFTNAIDASPPDGQIYIVSTISGGQEKEVQVFLSDIGEGIPKEHLDKVFEPFFTTKPLGQGTGLGLYVTYQILEDHHASITIDSQPGKGTTVSIGFPLLKEALALPSPGSSVTRTSLV